MGASRSDVRWPCWRSWHRAHGRAAREGCSPQGGGGRAGPGRREPGPDPAVSPCWESGLFPSTAPWQCDAPTPALRHPSGCTLRPCAVRGGGGSIFPAKVHWPLVWAGGRTAFGEEEGRLYWLWLDQELNSSCRCKPSLIPMACYKRSWLHISAFNQSHQTCPVNGELVTVPGFVSHAVVVAIVWLCRAVRRRPQTPCRPLGGAGFPQALRPNSDPQQGLACGCNWPTFALSPHVEWMPTCSSPWRHMDDLKGGMPPESLCFIGERDQNS